MGKIRDKLFGKIKIDEYEINGKIINIKELNQTTKYAFEFSSRQEEFLELSIKNIKGEKSGLLFKRGKVEETTLNNILQDYLNKKSLDINYKEKQKYNEGGILGRFSLYNFSNVLLNLTQKGTIKVEGIDKYKFFINLNLMPLDSDNGYTCYYEQIKV